VRTIHHAANAPALLQGVAQILAPGGAFVLEFANKRNLKAILRYLVRRQDWSPFAREPVEFAELNFDFHPAWMRERLSGAGLWVRQQRTVSHFRLDFLKRVVPTGLLVELDRLLQPTGGMWQLTPSIFVRCEICTDKLVAQQSVFFRCISCGSSTLADEGDALSCVDCGARFAVRDGIYDFKASLEGGAR
jgi:hypothetical protein